MAESENLERKVRGLPFRLVAVLTGLVAVQTGVAAYTFQYADGLSYFSKDPKACANCHIMQPQFDSWQKASHHAVATCVDCHLPHDFFGKYLAKAENGYYHSKGFTLQNFAEPIAIKEKNSRILQANCITCHQEFLHDILNTAPSEAKAVTCVHCHADAGHGLRAGLGGPWREDEAQ